MSQAYLSLLDNDFSEAMGSSLRRAKRYNDESGYCDYMSLLHVMGESEFAWPIFDSLINRFLGSQIWTSAFVGHRVNATSKENLRKWILDKKKLTLEKTNVLARYALLSLIDRQPDSSDIEFIGELELSWTPVTPNEERTEIKDMGKKVEYPYVSFFNIEERDELMSKLEDPKAHQSIAESYFFFKNGEYAKSFEILKKLSLVIGFGSPEGRQLIPYLILSAVKSGNGRLVENLVNKDYFYSRDYDMILAKAVWAGMNKDHDQSLKFFNKAFNNCPQIKDRLFFPWFQIVELLEWLYIDTGDVRYLDQAIIWAQKHQVIQPMFAWAFAFEAKYTKDHKKRLRALAYAQYLDENSAWISHFSSEDKTKAAVWFESHNPFTIKGQEGIKSQQSI